MKESFRSIIIKGTFVLTISNFLVSGLNYLSNSLSAKSLGPSGFGELSALFAYLSIFSIPLTVLTTLIIVKLGKAENNRYKTAGEIEQWFISKIREKKIYIFLSFSTLIFIPSLTNLSSVSALVLYILVAFNILSAFYFSLLQGLHLFTTFTLFACFLAITRLIGTSLTFVNEWGIYNIYTGLVLGSILAVGLSKKFMAEKLPMSNRILDISIRRYLTRKKTLITIVSLLSVVLLSNADLIFVKKLFTAEQAGIYSSWSLLAKIIGYFVAPVLSASLLFFSAKESERDQKKLLYILISLIIIIGSGILIAYQQFSTEILLVIFSDKFLSIAPLAPYAALFGMLFTIITLINNYHIANSNKSSLIVPLIIPIHVVLFLLYGSSIENIITINVGSTFFITGILTISLLHS